MNWKPEEADIIDYLYGSMTSEKREKFEAYVEAHPEVKQEINELRQTMNLLPSFQDQEVIAPVPFPGTESGRPTGQRRWLYPVSIAASVAIILLTGYFTNFRMSFNQDGFAIGFVDSLPSTEALSEAEIDQMITAGIETYADRINGQLTSLQRGFDQQFEESRTYTNQQIKQVSSRPARVQLDETQVQQFLGQLKNENDIMMQEFYLASAEEQQTYLRNILLEYSNYIEEQRQQDMRFFQASLLDIKSDTELKQEATDKILANIISTVNTQNSPINNNQSLD